MAEAKRTLVSHRTGKQQTLVFVPLLGLGNRLRALKTFRVTQLCSDFYAFSQSPYFDTKIFWPQTGDLNADYEDLFSSPKLDMFNISQVSSSSSFIILVRKYPDFTEDYFTKYLGVRARGHVRRYKTLWNMDMQILVKRYINRYDYVFIASAWDVYIRNNLVLNCQPFERDELREKFISNLKPSLPVQGKLQTFWKIKSQLPQGRLIGIHMRFKDIRVFRDGQLRTAPVNASIHVLKQHMNSSDSLFISTDSKEILHEFVEAFPSNKVFFNTFDGVDGRDSLEGMQNGLADMFSLAYCDMLWANSKESTFVRTAGEISQKEVLQILDFA